MKKTKTYIKQEANKEFKYDLRKTCGSVSFFKWLHLTRSSYCCLIFLCITLLEDVNGYWQVDSSRSPEPELAASSAWVLFFLGFFLFFLGLCSSSNKLGTFWVWFLCSLFVEKRLKREKERKRREEREAKKRKKSMGSCICICGWRSSENGNGE